MRLTLNLPDGLLEDVMQLAGSDRKTATIVEALHAHAAALRQAKLRALRGQSALLQPDPTLIRPTPDKR